MGSRRKGRELALQALYQLDITNEFAEGDLGALWEGFESGPRARSFAAGLVRGVLGRRDEIDQLVGEVSEHWRMERLSRVDLNVIRIAVYELTSEPPVPVEIVINEAIEVARRFGTEQSAGFVNGVLDQVAARLGLKARGNEKAAQNDG